MGLPTRDTSRSRAGRNRRRHVRATSIAVNISLIAGLLFLHAPRGQAADEAQDSSSPPITDSPPITEERFAIHGQATYVVQATDGFHAPYHGRNSLSPASNEETVDADLFFGARLWRGAEIWIQPEIDQGFGLDDTLGVAGFPSGEAYKVGAYHPYFRWARAFGAKPSTRAVNGNQSKGLPISSAVIAARTGGCLPPVSSLSPMFSIPTNMRTIRAAISSIGRPWMAGRMITPRMHGAIPSVLRRSATSVPGPCVPGYLISPTSPTAFT